MHYARLGEVLALLSVPLCWSNAFRFQHRWQGPIAPFIAWGGPIALKGIQSAEDANLAADIGVEAIYLSNHGGRQDIVGGIFKYFKLFIAFWSTHIYFHLVFSYGQATRLK